MKTDSVCLYAVSTFCFLMSLFSASSIGEVVLSLGFIALNGLLIWIKIDPVGK